MTEQMCPIWNRPARVSLKRGHLDLYEVDHPRAGGMYEITGTAKGMVGDRDAEFLRQATEFITRQNLMGLTPSVDSESVRRISEIALPWVGERAERLLKHLEMRSPTIGENVSFSEVETDRVLAATASLDNSEVSYLLEMLRDDLLLTFQGSGQHLPTVRITPAGHRKLHQWRTIQIESSQAFVAMWFSEGMTEAFASGIEPGIRDAGYNVMRIDRKEHSNKIDDEIIAEIQVAHAKGHNVARVHSGDPSIYGAIAEQMRRLDKLGIDYDVTPGVPAFAAAAAVLKTEFTLPEIAQTVILTRTTMQASAMPPGEELEELGRSKATLAIHLSIRNLGYVERALTPHYGADCPVIVVYRVTWPDQKIIKGTLSTIAKLVKAAKLTRTALILVGHVLDAREFRDSALYDAGHEHVLRNRKTAKG